MNGIILICPLLWTPLFHLHCMTEHWFQHLSTLVDIPLSVTLHDKPHCFWYLSTLVDTPLLFYSNTTSLLSRTLLWEYSYSYLPTDCPFFCLSTLVDAPLSDALYDRPLFLVLVHFSGHNLAILDIYLSVLFQFVHFSGHPSFNCITWWNAGFNACPL